ncbi:MAG: hypothetical protein QM482_09680 [Sulfurospirillum sp.]
MKFVVSVLFLLSFVFGDNLAQRLQKLINDKSEKKVEVLKYDPFFTKLEIKKTYKKDLVLKKKKKTVKNRELKLVSIMGTKAFVDGRWIAKGDVVTGYRVKKVLGNAVILYKKRKTIVLRFEKNAEILKVREK